MKKLLLFVVSLFLVGSPLRTSAHGVAVIDANQGTIMHLSASHILVEVNNQVARVVTRQLFVNTGTTALSPTYAFPMHPDASAIELRWDNGMGWEYAIVQTGEQDSLPGGGPGQGIHPNLAAYLGSQTLQFNPKITVLPGDSVIFELTYVELLPYKFNKVAFHYPNNYSKIQSEVLEGALTLDFKLYSGRSITAVDLLSHPPNSTSNDGDFAQITYEVYENNPSKDFQLEYELASDELGILDMSTFLPSQDVTCDSLGSGFITLVIEPEANTPPINKNFILVIDKSGSMGSANKMQQARDAASFIVENLNPDDRFNIVAFDNAIGLFKPQLQPYDLNTKNQALQYISTLNAGGSTNISGALTTAIGQFSVLDQGQANIILFFTDGQATSGVTSTSGILQAVDQAVQQAETGIFLFTFGIGADVNKSLLAQLAAKYNGLSDFLGADELLEKITDFFLFVNNPVLLNTQIEFDPPLISETWPSPLPNLYKGQQLILSGRYEQPGAVTMHLTGNAFNTPVSYQYNLDLSATQVPQYQFLPKLWAKSKIEALTTQYYISSDTNLLHTISDISECYGVISDFTSFQNNPNTTSVDEFAAPTAQPSLIVQPNPSRGRVRIILPTPVQHPDGAQAYIFDAQGRLVFVQDLGHQQNEFYWDGVGRDGQLLASGIYMAVVVDQERVYRAELVRL